MVNEIFSQWTVLLNKQHEMKEKHIFTLGSRDIKNLVEGVQE
jgi:hypothetical protein